MSRIKPEPGAGVPYHSAPPPGHNERSQAARARNHTRPPPSADSSSALSPDTRGHRSAAPTVESRRARQIQPIVVPSETDDEDELPLMTEVRPVLVKTEAGMRMNGPQQIAFTGIEAGDIDKNLKDIGQHLKKFNDTLGSLQQLGIHHDTPLPELILVGDQSSGKSSLMSAISQIILPRSDGVCTRCPIHIRLSSDTTWRCRVTLQQDYAYRPINNEPITEADVTEQNPFPPWVKQQREVKEFKMVYEKTDPIDEIVRWAQIAILNHNRNYKNFIPKDLASRTREELEPGYDASLLARAEENTEAKFSPNTVAIEVKGPNLPDLSFYDMPGVFRNAKHEEDQFLVKVVENLVRSYVSHEKAIILWAVPMNHDPETSSTFTLIRKLRAQARTIGVMTKADLLPPGGHHQWLAMLAGQQHQVGRGYFITSRAAPCLNGEGLDQEHGQRRDRASLRDESAFEEAFFNRRIGNWPQESADFNEKCGIDQLVKFLAQTLAQEFARNLPDLWQKLREKAHHTQMELRKLPEMPANPEYEVRKSLLKFTTDFQARLNSRSFSSSWAKIADAFRTGVIDLKPRYRVIPEGFQMYPRDVASDRESNFSASNSPSLSVKRARPIDLTILEPATSRRRRIDSTTVKVEEGVSQPSFNAIMGSNTANGRVESRTLGQIRSLIRSEREAGKPGEVPYDVMESLCMEAVKPWAGPLRTFIDSTMKHLREELNASLNESFKELKKRQVYMHAKKLTTEWLKSHRIRISEQLERNLKLETFKVYTMDEAAFERHRAHEAHMLRRNRHFYRWKAYNGDTVQEKIEDWDNMSADARRREEDKMVKESAKLGEDPFEAELGVASRVRGYYLTAAMRFVDITSMHITSGLFPDLEADVEQYLDKSMNLDRRDLGADVFVALMEEEQSTAERRVRLKAELERFDKAVQEISDLNQTVIQASANGASAPLEQQQDDQNLGHDDGDVEMDEV